ncbi:hypothetical protein QTN47_20690 [Danxiaibacter flavus]|uniref:Polysaccharide biosynthesis protein n=1 Tax=Danxiaibacter flavus TaxID=3049108 RepID=A0ABV3ZJF3_9BACT|nr:hypothetical protein QNM32_20695 [Chitinophagaceae bacterium DXS]
MTITITRKHFSALQEKLKRHAPLFAKFFSGHIAVQVLNMLNGFLLLRWLNIEDIAIFSMLFSIQTVMNSISDLGFSGSIVALTGEKYRDKKVLGAYMAAARHLRMLFFAVIAAITLLIAPFYLNNQAVNSYQMWGGFFAIIATVYWQADCSIYTAPLLIHKKLTAYYRPQIISSALRIAVNYALFSFNVINALSVLLINGLIILYIGRRNKKNAAGYYEKNVSNEAARKEILRYLYPIMPSNIFNAFFGQIQILIITYFGNLRNIAEVAALGRISQLFLFLSAINLTIIEPAIAKSTNEALPRKYMFVVFVALIIATGITWTSYAFPSVYLAVLGRKYAHLQQQLVWLIAGASVNFVSTTMWTMSSARKWVFWWGTIAYITAVVACQLAGVYKLDLSATTGVLQLSLITAIAVLLVQLSITIVGFTKDNRYYRTLYFQNT